MKFWLLEASELAIHIIGWGSFFLLAVGFGLIKV